MIFVSNLDAAFDSTKSNSIWSILPLKRVFPGMDDSESAHHLTLHTYVNTAT
jgi:hypothetical protein